MREQSMKVQIFIRKVLLLSLEMGVSISHQDSQGGFIIEDYSDHNAKWLQAAEDDTSGCTHERNV